MDERTANVEAVRSYRARKRTLERVQARLCEERRLWHAVWVKDDVPSRAIRELIDELCKIAEVGE